VLASDSVRNTSVDTEYAVVLALLVCVRACRRQKEGLSPRRTRGTRRTGRRRHKDRQNQEERSRSGTNDTKRTVRRRNKFRERQATQPNETIRTHTSCPEKKQKKKKGDEKK
ncbi:hypothetical protein IscW_ISCW009776, partial [Ixodes scapularis]